MLADPLGLALARRDRPAGQVDAVEPVADRLSDGLSRAQQYLPCLRPRCHQSRSSSWSRGAKHHLEVGWVGRCEFHVGRLPLLRSLRGGSGCSLITRRSHVQILPPPPKDLVRSSLLARSCRVRLQPDPWCAVEPFWRYVRMRATIAHDGVIAFTHDHDAGQADRRSRSRFYAGAPGAHRRWRRLGTLDGHGLHPDRTYPCPGALGTHHAVRSPHRSDGTRHASHADILVAIGQSPREPRQPATKSATEIARSAGQWRVMVAL